MTDKTSSMTSVTEEDSTDESDTTESVYSLAVSSVLSSSEYNTDDKLTPGLCKVSISNTGRNISQRKEIPTSKNIRWGSGFVPTKILSDKVDNAKAPQIFPYGSNPLPLGSKDRHLSAEGVDQTELSTDMSDTSITCKDKQRNLNNNCNLSESVNSQESNCYSASDVKSSDSESSRWRPFLPDLNSPTWYQAQCFDNYWSNYQFVMEWYKMHLLTVSKLSGQTGAADFHQEKKQHRSHRARKARQSRRARYRRRAKERFRNTNKEDATVSASASQTETASGSAVVSNEEMEMEVTDEMMQFFQTSLKHKMERDSKKEGLDNKEEVARVNIEQVVTGQHAPSTNAPVEQPGLRRTAELKYLYGSDAPMIHGMETALQLTFDRVSDRCQPKLWPNMPLKITFA